MSQRAENVEQELALRRGGIHLLGQRTKGDAALLEVVALHNLGPAGLARILLGEIVIKGTNVTAETA